MSHRLKLGRLLTGLFIALPLAGAHAVPVYYGVTTAAFIDGMYDQAGGTTDIPAAYLARYAGATAGSSTGDADGGMADATATSALNSVSYGEARISYHVTLVGPMSSTRIPFEILASGYAKAGDFLTTSGPYGASYYASADFTYQVNALSTPIFAIATAGDNGTSQSFSVDQFTSLVSGGGFDIYLDASASAGGSGSDPSFAHAFVDPSFIIDPAYASLYHFEGVPQTDVTNPTPPTSPPNTGVPEPSTVLLLLAGLGAIVFGARGKKISMAQSMPLPA